MPIFRLPDKPLRTVVRFAKERFIVSFLRKKNDAIGTNLCKNISNTKNSPIKNYPPHKEPHKKPAPGPQRI